MPDDTPAPPDPAAIAARRAAITGAIRDYADSARAVAPPDLTAIRVRLQEIVKPPWRAIEDEDGRIFIRSETTQEDVVSVMYYWGSAEFIAAAPADIDALLAVVTRLHAAIADLETQAAAAPPGTPRYEALDAQLELLYQIAGPP